MRELQICVYKDTINHKYNEDNNLSLVTVSESIVKQYLEERKEGMFKDMEDFLLMYTADDTEDFYEYATKHNAIIKVEDW